MNFSFSAFYIFRIYRFLRCKSFLFISALMLLTFVAGAQSNMPKLFPDRVIMNMAEQAETSVAVTWRTSLEVEAGYLEIQPVVPGPIDKGLSVSHKASSTLVTYSYPDEPDVVTYQHAVHLNNLNPRQSYLYRVGLGDYWSEWYEFQLDKSKSDTYSFLYLGDPQNDIRSQWSRVLRRAYAHNPSTAFVLYAGDLINRAGRDVEWQEWFDAGSYLLATVPQAMTPGNHDYRNRVLDPHWEYQFTSPKNGPEALKHTCYYVDFRDVRIISIDTAVDSELRAEDGEAIELQKVWLESVLQRTSHKWIILTTHLPIYSPKESRDNHHIRSQFQPLLEQYGVDLVLTGHDHTYARGRASDDPDQKFPIPYVVSVSGPKVYEVGDKSWIEKGGSNIQLYQEVTISGNRMRFDAYTADGVLFDRFELKKRTNGTNRFIDLDPVKRRRAVQ